MSAGRFDAETMRRHLLALDQTLAQLARHTGGSVERLGILPPELAQRLRPLAGFRNVLVHGYLVIDLDRVHAVLNSHLDDVREFARCVDAYIAAPA